MAKPHFRAGVVIVVRRSDGQVLAFERADLTGEWQLPQGGIESGETPEQAAWRELREETGLTAHDVELVDQHTDWTVYEWPADMRSSQRIGQVHRWFFFEALDDDLVPQPDGREFSGWQWITVDELIGRVVDFRKRPYRQVLGTMAGNGG
jgi:putative (di)nucleoside polyphosphate hydrolase